MGHSKFTAPRRGRFAMRRSQPRSTMRTPASKTFSKSAYDKLIRDAARLGVKSMTSAPARASTTMVRRKTNDITKKIARPGLGGLPSFSKFSLINPANSITKTMKKATEPSYWVNNFASQVTNAEGFQGVTSYSFANLDHLKQIASYVPQSVSQVSFPNPPRRYLLESVTGEFLMTNSSLATQYVDIYDIVRKRDAGKVAGGLSYTGTPVDAWQKGVSDQSNLSPDMTAYTNINSLPTDSKLFCDYFRVVRRTHIGLIAGATHRHQVILKPNRIVDTALLDQLSGDPKGLTTYTMVVINGQPCSIAQEPPAGSLVTTATTALDIVWSARFKYSWLANNSRQWVVQDNLVSLKGEVITQPSLGAFVLNTKV